MLSKDEFFEKYNITEEMFEAAQISWDALERIHDKFACERDNFIRLGKEFQEEFFKDIVEESQLCSSAYRTRERCDMKLHSIYWRVKDPEHLVEKIIRKRTSNYKWYGRINEDNYQQIVTDLVGFRGMLVFKEDWGHIHERIMNKLIDDPEWYRDHIDFDRNQDIKDYCLAEPPTAHIREGDDKSLYLYYLGEANIVSKQNYRSVHYVVGYHGIYIEFQIRTLFEDAFAEIDHRLRYPLQASDEKLTRYAGIINHLAGAVDELGSFYLGLASPQDQEALTEKKGEIHGMVHHSQAFSRKEKEQSIYIPPQTIEQCLLNKLKQ